MSRDMRVDVILLSNEEHMVSRAASKEARGGEEWVCRCGTAYKGDGALRKGRRHVAEQALAALDEATVTA